MAIFYGASIAYLFDEDQTKAIEACMVDDPVEVEMMAAMLGVLDKYNDDPVAKFTFDKYFATIQTLDKFNWAPCGENKELMTLIDKDVKWWTNFWTQKDAGKQIEENAAKNAKELGEAVTNAQKSWADEDFAAAGKNYGKMWSLLMGGKPAEKTEVFGWSE